MQWTQSPILIRIRFFASLVVLTYTATHFLNHALGLISLDALEGGRKIFLAFWRNSVLQFLFPLALFLHAQSAIWRLMFRQSWRFSRREKIKILTGLAIPLLLLMHLAGTRMQWWVYGHNDTYAYFLYQNLSDGGIWFVLVMSILVWVHGFYGVTAMLDLKPFFARYRTAFVIGFVALPLLGLAGIISATAQVAREMRDAAWVRQVLEIHGGDPQKVAETKLLFYLLGLAGLVLLVALLVVIRQLLLRRGRRHATIQVSYADGPRVKTNPGVTLLEVSLVNGIEHAHVCGGNGRCSTCRVRILDGVGNLSLAESIESALLSRISAESDVRLACQARVRGNVKIAPLISTGEQAATLLRRKPEADGVEREIVVFFSDLRGFTAFSESRLPYDVVFVLNQYFRSMGKIIEEHAGHIDKFIGDGIMAIFGLNEDINHAAAHALEAAYKMQAQLTLMNEFLAAELKEPLELRIGLHAGPAIVGELGYGGAARFTAIGDVVNTASRLEHANKKLGTWLLASEKVLAHAGQSHLENEIHLRIRLRGKTELLGVHGVKVPR
ncbi:MAG: adenylate/guanylate cyclase domain-containing protein [Turneriella sp.]